ncbi:MAG: hypothetical protein PHE36_10955 [Novosphingobium sp.]|nr:hypothetical protein [Novosphingobium sp.]
MRKLRMAFIAGVVAMSAAGAAVAATAHIHTMKVDLPDGSVAQIHYTGDVAPKVEVVPAAADDAVLAFPAAFAGPDEAAFFAPFARMDRIMAQMEQRHRAMLRQVAQMDAQAQNAAANGAAAPAGLVMAGTLPAGTSVHYSFYSSSNGKDGCTRTVEWRSDGSDKQPQITRTSSGDCDSAKPSAMPQSAAEAKPAAPESDPRQLPGQST